jgi:hypothetical protein
MSYEATLIYVASPYEPAGPDRCLAIGYIRWGRGRERLPDAKIKKGIQYSMTLAAPEN